MTVALYSEQARGQGLKMQMPSTSISILLKSIVLVLMLVASTHAQTQADFGSAADAQSIRTVIEAELAALAADDAEAAFSVAPEGIRRSFGTADNFIAMVKASYAVVYRPATVLFLDPEKLPYEIMQRVEMSDDTDRPWLAIYRMQRQRDGTWRIDGWVSESMPGSRM